MVLRIIFELLGIVLWYDSSNQPSIEGHNFLWLLWLSVVLQQNFFLRLFVL